MAKKLIDIDGGFFRRATEEDIQIYFDWVNEAEVRKNSVSSKPILWEEHESWFRKKLNDENAFLYVAGLSTQELWGQVRFDITENTAYIDYSVDAAYRNQGLGFVLLLGSLKTFKEEVKDQAIQIKALVKKENIASGKIFKKLDFQLTGTEEIENQMYDIYTLSVLSKI